MAIQIETDALAEAIDGVRASLQDAPEPPIATFAADSRLAENFRAEVTVRDFNFVVDEPPTIGGTDAGPTPVELILAALGTCQEIVFATYARVLNIPVDSVSVHAEGRLDLRGFFGVGEHPAGFSDVSFDVTLESSASESDVQRLIAAVNSHCPVLDILRQPIPVSGTYQLNGATLSTSPN